VQGANKTKEDGMKVVVRFTENSKYGANGVDLKETFEDVIEVHYNYPSPLKTRSVAIEMEDTGYTYALDDIAEFEVFK
jgi:hypothetical protein